MIVKPAPSSFVFNNNKPIKNNAIKNPFVYIFAIPLYIIKFVLALVVTVIDSFGMAVGMILGGTDGKNAKNEIHVIWDWFKKGIF